MRWAIDPKRIAQFCKEHLVVGAFITARFLPTVNKRLNSGDIGWDYE
jgi:hypothetical protein